MLNLHAPFRRAASGDESRIAKLAGRAVPPIESTVVADEDGQLTALLIGEPDGETWRIKTLAVAPERLKELAPRILAIADALAADEGLASVTMDAGGFAEDMLAILDREGFRPVRNGAGQGGSKQLVRPVVPQG